MNCVVLGNGGMMPMPLRLTTSVLVRREGRMIMFDAGEGIQLALKKGGLGIAALDAVVISHLHADHVLGLPGIMMFRAQNENVPPLTIVGPPGIGRFIRHVIGDLGCHITFPYHIIEWSQEAPEIAYNWFGVSLKWYPLDHSVFCLGYRLEEPERPGKFHLQTAVRLGVPKGPLFGRLQRGETVTLPDGGQVRPDAVLGPPRQGRQFAYATDTRPCIGLNRTLQNADIAVVEGMFAEHHQAEAAAKKHMTVGEAATAAKDAGVERLILVHISPRYTTADEASLQSEAAACMPTAEISKPLAVYEMPLKA